MPKKVHPKEQRGVSTEAELELLLEDDDDEGADQRDARDTAYSKQAFRGRPGGYGPDCDDRPDY